MTKPSDIDFESLIGQGSSCFVLRLNDEPGWIVKTPRHWSSPTLSEQVQKAFQTETAILPLVTPHPRVVEFDGVREGKEINGLRFREYIKGDLQSYLHRQKDIENIDLRQRLRWCQQVTEAVLWIHSKNVIHCDLRPDNILLNEDMELCLADFGSATCEDIDIYGGRLPDAAFLLPYGDVSPDVDIFSLGSIMYILMTGRYPHGSAIPLQTEREINDYEDLIRKKFKEGDFPDVKDLLIGKVIKGCWEGDFFFATEVFAELQALIN